METYRSHPATGAFSACLDAVDLGIALVERGGALLFANATLRRYARAGPFSIGSSLRFHERAVEAAIRAAVAAATSGAPSFARESCVVRVRSESDGVRPFVVSIATAAPGVAVLLFGIAGEKRAVDRARIEAAFGLSPAEGTVALALLDGNDVDEIARRSGISRETVRTHLRRLFEKTQTGRQPALVLALQSIGALTRAGDDANDDRR